MAVALDAVVASDTAGTGVATITLAPAFTVGAGSNRALTVTLALNRTGVSGGAVNWDNAGTPQAMTQISTVSSATNNIRADVFGLVNPTSGTKALVATWTGNSDVCIACASWTGVDQSGGTTSFPHGTTAAAVVPTGSPQTVVTITSAVGNMGIHSMATLGTTTACGNTQIFSDTSPATMSAAASRAAGAASIAWGWTVAGGAEIIGAAIDIQASGAAANVIFPKRRPFPFKPGSATRFR